MNDDRYFSQVGIQEIVSKLQAISKVSLNSIWDFLQAIEASEDWVNIDDWEELDDLQIYERLTHDVVPTGLLYVVSDATFTRDGNGIEIEACNIRRWIVEHRALYGECVFGLDTFIFSFDQRIAWIFHHEAVYTIACKIFAEKS